MTHQHQTFQQQHTDFECMIQPCISFDIRFEQEREWHDFIHPSKYKPDMNRCPFNT